MTTLTGVVFSCVSTKKSGGVVRDLTKIELAIPENRIDGDGYVWEENKGDRPVLLSDNRTKGIKLNLYGMHRIKVGEEMRAEYQCHTGVNWISAYEILKNGKITYRSEGHL